MQAQSRIPKLQDTSFDGAITWFAKMQSQSLLFHPEDDPAEIIAIPSGERFFSATEVDELRFLIRELDFALGHEKMIEAAYPIFMHACGMRLDA